MRSWVQRHCVVRQVCTSDPRHLFPTGVQICSRYTVFFYHFSFRSPTSGKGCGGFCYGVNRFVNVVNRSFGGTPCLFATRRSYCRTICDTALWCDYVLGGASPYRTSSHTRWYTYNPSADSNRTSEPKPMKSVFCYFLIH